MKFANPVGRCIPLHYFGPEKEKLVWGFVCVNCQTSSERTNCLKGYVKINPESQSSHATSELFNFTNLTCKRSAMNFNFFQPFFHLVFFRGKEKGWELAVFYISIYLSQKLQHQFLKEKKLFLALSHNAHKTLVSLLPRWCNRIRLGSIFGESYWQKIW